MAARRTEEQNERRERLRQEASSTPSSTAKSAGNKRKPRGALFHGEDPTLAKRTEEELQHPRPVTLIVDTGGLLSVLDGNQDDHDLFLEAVQTARGPLLVSPLILAELDHLILDRYGRQAELTAIEEIESAYQVERIEDEDLIRARHLLIRYADLTTFDLADASCVVLAERYGCFDILTTDQRDFRTVAGHDGQHFRILPYDL